ASAPLARLLHFDPDGDAFCQQNSPPLAFFRRQVALAMDSLSHGTPVPAIYGALGHVSLARLGLEAWQQHFRELGDTASLMVEDLPESNWPDMDETWKTLMQAFIA